MSKSWHSDSIYFNLRPVVTRSRRRTFQPIEQTVLYFSIVIDLLLLKHSGSIRCEFGMNSGWIWYEFGVNSVWIRCEFGHETEGDHIIREFSPNSTEFSRIQRFWSAWRGAQHLRRPVEDDEGAEKPRKPNCCKTYLGNKSIHHCTPATDHTPGISKVWADPADNLIGLGVGSPIVSAKWSQCNFKFAEFGGNVPGNTCNLCGKW